MQKKSNKIFVWSLVAVFLILVLGSFFVPKKNVAPGKLDSFAQCLKDKGAVFYGAYWCSHCQAQKKLFGDSQRLLPYVECATPNGNAQEKVCTDANIDGYPTWVFPDGTRQSGEVALEELAKKTGCQLPQ